MSLGKRLAAKRQAKRSQIEVAEWGEDNTPLQIFSSFLNCGDVDRLQRKHPNFITNMTIAAMVDLIILKAEDKDGEKLFTLEDKPFLMREPVTLISNIAGQMFATVESVESLGND
jgi:hypothetical protein